MNKIYVFVSFLFAGVLCGLLLVSCGRQEPVKRNPVVGILNPNPGSRAITLGFMEGLKELGYFEGDNITFHEAQCNKVCDIDAALQGILAKQPDLIFTVTTPATRKAQAVTQSKNIFLVFAMNDPVGSGIVNSLTSPGENLTGVQISGSVPKSLEWLLEIVPETKKILVPIRHDTKAAKQSLAELQEIAKVLGVQVVEQEVKDQDELDRLLAALPDDIDALYLLHSILISSNAGRIVQAAQRKKLPTVTALPVGDQGVLVAFSHDHFNVGKQASRLAYIALREEAAGEIPVEIAEFFLTVNLQTAATLDLDIPDGILLKSDRIIR
ncbi:ABC transporter substrate-binding protein [Thermodesulfobacteriota bacterium]